VPALHADSLANLRDLGGIAVQGGRRVRRGAVLRSADLHALDPDEPAIAVLGIRTVVDLRTAPERAARPDRLPHGARMVVLDALADREAEDPQGAAAARVLELMANPPAANAALGDGRAVKLMEELYRAFVTDASAHEAFRAVVELAADPAAHPVLIHCTAGKDRTGWASAVILLLLGADERDVTAEYLAVQPAVDALFRPLTERFAAGGGDPAVAAALIGTAPGYLAAGLSAAVEKYGSVEGYARSALGVPDGTLSRLRTLLTE
jgi:protein-tyrosine phosphatase